MRRFDKKKKIQEANLRLEQDYIFERMLMTEIGDAEPYEIHSENDSYRSVKYKVTTQQHGTIDVLLKMFKLEKYSFENNSKLSHVGIEYMGDKDYALEISFNISSPGMEMYPTLNGTQAAKIMATNVEAINEYVNQKHNEGMRLIMVYSSPITDENDRNRQYAFRDLKRYINNRKLSEREIKTYVITTKKLNDLYKKVRDYIIYGDYKMNNDESQRFGTDFRELVNSLRPDKYFTFLCMFDNNFNLRTLTEKVKQEIPPIENTTEFEGELAKEILTKLRDAVSNRTDYIEDLVRNSERNPRDIDAREGTMRENLYNRSYDEQIASNPLLKNFVKFKTYSESGIYDELKAQESKEEKRIADEKEAERRAEEARRRAEEEARQREEEEARRREEEAIRSQVLTIKINRNSNLYFKMPNIYKALKSSEIRDKVTINDPINDTIRINGIDEQQAKEIIGSINASPSLNVNLKNGDSGVELTFGNQPFDI